MRRFRAEGLVIEVRPTPTFALSKAGFDEWAGRRDPFRMEDFHHARRRRFDVLMEGERPVGGGWNLDDENREPPPKDRRTLGVAGPWTPTEDEVDERVRADPDRAGYPTVGADGPRRFAVTHREATAAEPRAASGTARPAAAGASVAATPGTTRCARMCRCRSGGPRRMRDRDVPVTVLEGVRDGDWVHHIPRLMILGNHAAQRGYRPAELDEWFAVDGFAWVVPPTGIGRSRHADGGRMATKPYTAGGAYLDG